MFNSARRWAAVLAGAVFIAFIVTSSHLTRPVQARDEVRALWVVRTSLTSPQAIEDMVVAAKQSGFNTLLVQVRGRGDSYFVGRRRATPRRACGSALFRSAGDGDRKGT